MKPIVIVKVGSTLPALIARKGNFEDWILSGMGLPTERIAVTDVRNGDALPEPNQVSGIVIGGSHAMVTDRLDWSERTSAWLAEAVAKGIPTLGICYGHQLLAHTLGGKVGNNPNGLEYGTVDVHLAKSTKGDRLLAGLPSPLKAHVSHTQTVLQLPKQARRLASSTKDANQAFVVGASAWGVQFHPEFDLAVTVEYIRHSRQALLDEGQDPEHLMETCVDTPHSAAILKRFVSIVNGGSTVE